jgi:hypothetical protein
MRTKLWLSHPQLQVAIDITSTIFIFLSRKHLSPFPALIVIICAALTFVLSHRIGMAQKNIDNIAPAGV